METFAIVERVPGRDVYTFEVIRRMPEGVLPDRYAMDASGVWHPFADGDTVPVSVCELPGPAFKLLKQELADPGAHMRDELAAVDDLLLRGMGQEPRRPHPEPTTTRWTAIGQKALAWLRS